MNNLEKQDVLVEYWLEECFNQNISIVDLEILDSPERTIELLRSRNKNQSILDNLNINLDNLQKTKKNLDNKLIKFSLYTILLLVGGLSIFKLLHPIKNPQTANIELNKTITSVVNELEPNEENLKYIGQLNLHNKHTLGDEALEKILEFDAIMRGSNDAQESVELERIKSFIEQVLVLEGIDPDRIEYGTYDNKPYIRLNIDKKHPMNLAFNRVLASVNEVYGIGTYLDHYFSTEIQVISF